MGGPRVPARPWSRPGAFRDGFAAPPQWGGVSASGSASRRLADQEGSLRLHPSLPLFLALAAVPATAFAQSPEPSGKFSRAPTASVDFVNWTPSAVSTMLSADSQRIIDVHVTSASPLELSGATVSNSGAYGISSWWDFGVTASGLGALSDGGTRRPVLLKGYMNGSTLNYVIVLVDNTGSNARGTWTFADTTLAALSTFLSENTARIIDMSTWLEGSTRHYSAIAISNTGTDFIALPPVADFHQFEETTPANLKTIVANAQGAGFGARVIDLESEGSGEVLGVLAFDGALRNQITAAGAVAADSWYYPALTLGVGLLPEQSWNHVAQTTGGRVVSLAPDVVGGATDWDIAFLQQQAAPAMSPLPASNNDGSNQFGYVDTRIQTTMRQYDITGAAIAIARGNQLVYTRGYGFADTEYPGGSTQAQPNTMFRIGSISKMMATTAILQMIEAGTPTPGGSAITLGTLVFPDILRPYFGINVSAEGSAAYTSASGPGGLENITVAEVLSHSAGWEDNNCDLDCTGNPLTNTACVAGQIGIDATPTCAQIVSEWMINKELQYQPGELPPGAPPGVVLGKYSNFAFCVAETIVDAMAASAGSDYETVVFDNILTPLHAWDADTGDWLFTPGLDTYAATPGEAHDYAFPWTPAATSKLYPFTAQVDAPYGGVPLGNGLGAGGWKASVTALAKWGVYMNQSTSTGQLVSGATFNEMIAYHSTSYSVLACGQSQTPTPGIGYFGLTVEMQTGDGDAWKSGGVIGGGGFVVWSNLLHTYDFTTNTCPDCITWVALVNTNGDGAPSGQDYDPPTGINGAMGDAIAQPSVQAAIAAATVDLFPAYVGP
jgi:CubicO group peptidase (beta-lactamase class C family)